MIRKSLEKNGLIILYGTSLGLLLLLMKWLELRFIIVNHAFEIYIGTIAVIFTALGIWISHKLIKPKSTTIVVEKEIFISNVVEKQVLADNTKDFIPNDKEITGLGLSKRELEVLQLIANGLSNQEIASSLYVSLNTIKTHASKLFEKMDVKRRTQAIEKAKRIGILP